MAIGGSFHFQSELDEFLRRCPELKRLSRFENIPKLHTLTEEEVVDAMAELFLLPNITIQLIGCFRPIAQKIVDKVVDLLRRNMISSFDMEFNKEKFIRESFATFGKGLNLHELASLAFCRVLDLSPSLLESVKRYFKYAPPPFEMIRQRELIPELLALAQSRLLFVLRASYCFLIAEPKHFTELWCRPCFKSCFLDLVQQSSEFDPGDNDETLSDIKWCGVQILSIIFNLSERATAGFGLGAEEAFQCVLRWNEFCQDISLEKTVWYLESVEEKKYVLASESADSSQGFGLSSFGVSRPLDSSSGLEVLVEQKFSSGQVKRDKASSQRPFIMTSAVKKSFEMVQVAVRQRWPILLYGPPGSGKTALICKVAGDFGSRVLSIHMDDQIDGKTLVGSYVCTEQPGEFRWQPGSLTQAVLNGFWVVFEDIDRAPCDVQSILLPLLEGASSFSCGHGEAISVAESFRLFATVSSSKSDASCSPKGGSSLSSLWRRVRIVPPCKKDLLHIVENCNSKLLLPAEELIETFERVNQIVGYQFGSSYSSASVGRYSLRDLLKWCKRIDGEDGQSVSSSHNIYREAVDLFAASLSSTESRLIIMKEIAKIWGVLFTDVDAIYPCNKPAIQESRSDFSIGRVCFQRTQAAFNREKKSFVGIRSSLHVLERIACSVKHNEPVLLVGETGTGKTTLVQTLAMWLGQKLTVLNLSQQSDVADLLGGFKPMNAQFLCFPLYMEFENLFNSSFSLKDNEAFLSILKKYLSEKNWKMLLSAFRKAVQKIHEISTSPSGTKRKRPLSKRLQGAWHDFSVKLEAAHMQLNVSDGMIFSFVEGAFITALKNGEWILLDEVNLAPPETLQRVLSVLEDDTGSLCLAERGDVDYISRHPSFRIFACMNPATDAGKKDLPFALRSRFTEYFVGDVLDDEDLVLFVSQFMENYHQNEELVRAVVRFYKAAKKLSDEKLQDGANQKPQYSLRSLYRALEYTRKARKNFGFEKAFYDGFCMFFLTLLDESSSKLMIQLISSYLLGGKIPPEVSFDGYLMIKGKATSNDLLQNYVLTKSVRGHLKNLARAIFIGRYPVLLQGPTSSGKTSLVQYLAAITGHEFVRVNNHEHTDLQEYLGSYITDANGKLVFHEGVLVTAVRKGYWIVLDELNLAPSDVLEALNRLLDDNRELFVPELRETVHAHPDFMLFATQNPPTFYGGRKYLSRAFRNRFVEIHVDEIPQEELSTILENRCKIPDSYAKKMVEVMKDLQLHRQGSNVFSGKHGFITPRDLFRWAIRFRTFGKSYRELACDGYYLLAERLRDDGEKRVVQEVLERQLRVKLAEDEMYKQESGGWCQNLNLDKIPAISDSLGNIIWTRSMQRLYFLVERCYKLQEPVLLVGETGGGKTTVCQLLSIVLRSELHILNCHQYTETSDFLGGFFPIRERSQVNSQFKHKFEQLMQSKAYLHFRGDITISSDINQASATLDKLAELISSYRKGLIAHPDVTLHELDSFEQMTSDLTQLYERWHAIFMWQDGPLVQAMKNGNLFLVDEISLADDSVLERLNSVLEPERKLALAEKGGSDLESITAHPNFFLLATMNPGGDYGKKELSPALRNRFTEIWVPPISDIDELKVIALNRIASTDLSWVVDLMLNFWEWFNQLQTGRVLTVRDLSAWVTFINVAKSSLQLEFAFLHGAFLILLDGLSLGTGISKSDAGELREKCFSFLLEQLLVIKPDLDYSKHSGIENYGWTNAGSNTNTLSTDSQQHDSSFGIYPFYIQKGDVPIKVDDDGNNKEIFEFFAPTTRRNALRLLRAMQLEKPVLLEGSPGVGKTSLIVALGKISGHKVVRINLSEQTDMSDLLGSDLPVEVDQGMEFAWSDGILLQAIKKGYWVLLDELNLAPQSVLEGLNSILDHRAEIVIPELGRFKCPSSFRVFACQNPSYQGGGRKGLPKSFLNRFTKVYVDELVEHDYEIICTSKYPDVPKSILSKLILFNKRLYEDTMLHHKFARDGSPWEFNLRDVERSCQIIQGAHGRSRSDCFLDTVYVQRMRTAADRQEVVKLYEDVFGLKPFINPFPRVQLNPQYLIVGNASIKRNHFQSSEISNSVLKVLPGMRHTLEAVAHCVQHQWLSILIGPTSSGKTSLIRLLAELSGNVLHELNLSSATDISELLGCFEQYNASRNYQLAVDRVQHYINDYCSLNLEPSTDAFIRRKNLFEKWLAFLSSTAGGGSTNSDNLKAGSSNSITLLIEIVDHLKKDYHLLASEDLDRILKKIINLQKDFQKKIYSAKFEWVSGLLVRAVENGDWIVLENANLCNPTVLDRINSLVEQSGSITVTECGTVNGKPVVRHPHCQFRMFLTVNPNNGEVSRAMRNRGIEIYIMQPYWFLSDSYCGNEDQMEIKDAKRFIELSGIPVGKLVNSMAIAHVFAKRKGSGNGIRITYLELARCVQLFKCLVTYGNQPLWSLQISWEHTYMSSLGEDVGKITVDQAISSYLSISKLDEFESSQRFSMSLLGGWPTPLQLRDLVWYSKEASVKQNCLYLEVLGALCASSVLGASLHEKARTAMCSWRSYLIDEKMLHELAFPMYSGGVVMKHGVKSKSDEAVVNKMLLFATNWVIEQATEVDIDLYLVWFEWFGSQLQSFCKLFDSFLKSFRKELEHPIWNCIKKCRSELIARHSVNLSMDPIPMLSPKFVDMYADDMPKSCSEIFHAIKCVDLLRLSKRQWDSEEEYIHCEKTRCFVPVLKSLQRLEERTLDLLISPLFDVLFPLYRDLIENHILFWECITSTNHECMLIISSRSLVKFVAKFKDFFPSEVENFQVESENLSEVPSGLFVSQKSLLWAHGGHPFLPSSSELYQKQHQFSNLCDSVWPGKEKLLALDAKGCHTEATSAFDPELRTVVLGGACMSFLVAGVEKDDLNPVQELEAMYQMLLTRFDFEKQKLQVNVKTRLLLAEEDFSGCCIFSREILCAQSGFSSWLDTLPIVDSISFFLDMNLLPELSQIVIMQEVDPDLSSLYDRLKSTLSFSLNYSSRSYTDFSPHQKILWILDAWKSVNSVHAKLSSLVLEMWVVWHKYVWSHHGPRISKERGYDLQPELFGPVITIAVDQIMKSGFTIRDFPVHCLKLRAAARSLWQSSLPVTDVHKFLISTAQSLFQWIIMAHKKSFEVDNYERMKYKLHSMREERITQDDIEDMISLIGTSQHHELPELMSSFIKPLLSELYHQRSSTDSTYDLGCAWIRIGGLRYHLLVCCNDLDPAIKNGLKYSRIMAKIASLELEIEVRKECVYLAGCFPSGEADNERADLLSKLKDEQKRLQKQIVYRSDPEKFKKLRDECDDFLKHIKAAVTLIERSHSMDVNQFTEEVHNWQETADGFVLHLSDEYVAYIDVAQPIQLAVYEMKIGLSLLLLSSLQKKLPDDTDTVLGTIYSFMRFPRGCPSRNISVNFHWTRPQLSFSDVVIPQTIEAKDASLLKNLVTLARDADTNKMTTMLLCEAALYQNVLRHITHSVFEAHFMDKASFELLDDIFCKFAKLWMEMKVEGKIEENLKAQQFKFRARDVKAGHVIKFDLSSIEDLFGAESLLELQELLYDEEFAETKKDIVGNVSLAEDWNFLDESMLNNMVHTHNQLFGLVNLVQMPESTRVSDADRLSNFIDSYTLGTGLIKDLKASSTSCWDAKLMPEHLLRLCLDHELKIKLTDQAVHAYNFYKDSNASVMSKLVEPIATLQKHIRSLSNEWDDHPALQKILDVTDVLLALPLSTPISKALSSLQYLLSKVRLLQETVARFPLSDELEPIFVLVSSWLKLEFESWPALLDEVEAQFEINAGMLWFPLYSVLQHRQSADIHEYGRYTKQSLLEFVQTSNIGGFGKRLQLLFAFHGQISCGLCRNIYSSQQDEQNVKILYNTFGYYVQFLPRILEHIDANRRNIEKELKQLSKLFHWERCESFLTIEISKRTRQKLKKYIKKYTEILQEPVMNIINLEAAKKGLNCRAIDGQNLVCDSFERNKHILDAACSQTQFRDEAEPVWFAGWKTKVNFVLGNLQNRCTTVSDPSFTTLSPVIEAPSSADDGSFIWNSEVSQPSSPLYVEQRKQVFCTIEKLCRTANDCGEIWKDQSKSLGKRRALSELLKLLDSCGLSKHRTTFLQNQCKEDNLWLLQPSYDVQHLLLTHSRSSSGDVDATAFGCSVSSSCGNTETNWRTANEYYFKSLASVNLLREICLVSHKDFTLEEVNRTASYLDHLVEIQKDQRAAAYKFAEQLKYFRQCQLLLKNLARSSSPSIATRSNCSFKWKQEATFKCMWQQKQLFDSLCAVLHEACLLLKSVESNHLNSCQSVEEKVKKMRIFIEKFKTEFQESKGSLDKHLLDLNSLVATVRPSLHPSGITVLMEQLVKDNFKLVREFEDNLLAFRKQVLDGGLVKLLLVDHFEDIIQKVNLLDKEYCSDLNAKSQLDDIPEDFNVWEREIAEVRVLFVKMKNTCKHAVDVFSKVGFAHNGPSVESLQNISMWEINFESFVANLELKSICEKLAKAINYSGKMMNHCNSGENLKQLDSLMDLMFSLGEGLLHDFLVMHSLVARFTYVLADNFSSLYHKGFGTSVEELLDDSEHKVTQDANGTGMGEGSGLNDVSDQIVDEDQLMSTSEKSEDQNASNDVPSKNDKGVEMEQDFDADTFSVSAESGDDDNEDGEEEQLDSAMGKTGADSETVDEKPCDQDDDEHLCNPNEKSGPPVKDKVSEDRELGAKGDSANTPNESEEYSLDEPEKEIKENELCEGADGTENMEDLMDVDNEPAFSDPTDLKHDEPNQTFEENTNTELPESTDPTEDDAEKVHESTEYEHGEDEDAKSADMLDSEQFHGDAVESDQEKNYDKNTETDLSAPMKDMFELGAPNIFSDDLSNAESTVQPKVDSHDTGSANVAPEVDLSNCHDFQNDLVPMRGLPNSVASEITAAELSKGCKLREEQPKTQLPQYDYSSVQKIQPNPCRNVGDALDRWKERVKVSVDIQDSSLDAPDELLDEKAYEYGYTGEFEKGTSQALGPATSEQIDRDMKCNDPDQDGATSRNEPAEMEIEKQHCDTHIRSYAMDLENEFEKQMEISDFKNQPEGSVDINGHPDVAFESVPESSVFLSRSYMSEEMHELKMLSVKDDQLGKACKFDEVPNYMKDHAATLWRRYELLTRSLSQELAERLRLAMEPTLASKLQGDYKTGKRINMKKVISYIASHYRKDKIWLRRTRPNKRDYQVVIAVDDSRSMSENHCGNVAIEALVTVCRATSQLEVGNLAVASYGKKGNIRLLHEFDQPFTGEAGIKMISSLTFNQENTIADEPMVDLLKYLDNMLDTAVANARHPSGHNPLQQLVLIIADGRFHEKEKLRRCVRDFLSKKRLIGFILLDNPQESIVDLMEASFQGGKVELTRYLDLFPFPYYVLLKNIDALPRTLGDLLRQWFELMQYSKD